MASPPSSPTSPDHLPSSTHLLSLASQPLLAIDASQIHATDSGSSLHDLDDSIHVPTNCKSGSLMNEDLQVVHAEESHHPKPSDMIEPSTGMAFKSLDENEDLQVVHAEESHHPKPSDMIEPSTGMAFKSLDEVHQFYYAYAQVQGFNVRIRNSACFPRSKAVRYRHYVCSCEGYCIEESRIDVKKEKKTLTIRKGCPVNFTVSRKSVSSQWVVINVENVHNHVLVSPRSVKNLRNQKSMPAIAKNLVERFSEAGLPTGRVSDILSDEPLVNISSRDCWNHMRNLRTRNLDVGDAESVFQYCKMKQAQDPNFYYSIFPDKESRMINFFWIDSRARLYYERFGDVVVFDTTYKTNKYGMPFGLFVGGNHHFQSIIFGCALLQDEHEESFVWLFETWLDAMNGKASISILTDQDQAITNAIKKVFPNTAHRLCLWHIMKKFPEKFGNLYKKKSPFKKDMKKCLHQSITVEDFENEWLAIMRRYNLEGDTWLQQIYNIRKSWVPVYNRTVFYAGMNTTQRCESMHSFFDAFVHSGTTLREFVSKYEQALMCRYKEENREHYASKHLQPVPKVRPPIAEHAATVYTRAIFNMFEDEVFEGLRLTRQKLEKIGSFCTYLVSSNQNPNQKYIVSIDTSSWDATCECHLFEFKGILCRHILAIFQRKDVQKIPAKYILPRWTKEAADDIPIPLAREADKSSIIRTMHFHRQMNLLLPCVHDSVEAYQIIIDAMHEAYEVVFQMKDLNKQVGEMEIGQTENEALDRPLGDPQISKTKGRNKGSQNESRNGRLKGGFEIRMNLANKKKTKVSYLS